MKDQDKNSEEDLSEVEIANLLNKGFKVMTVKMIKELRRRDGQISRSIQPAKIESRRNSQFEHNDQ